MPELPEVEVTRLGLAPLINATVYNVEVRNFSLRWPVNPNLKKKTWSSPPYKCYSLQRRSEKFFTQVASKSKS